MAYTVSENLMTLTGSSHDYPQQNGESLEAVVKRATSVWAYAHHASSEDQLRMQRELMAFGVTLTPHQTRYFRLEAHDEEIDPLEQSRAYDGYGGIKSSRVYQALEEAESILAEFTKQEIPVLPESLQAAAYAFLDQVKHVEPNRIMQREVLLATLESAGLIHRVTKIGGGLAYILDVDLEHHELDQDLAGARKRLAASTTKSRRD